MKIAQTFVFASQVRKLMTSNFVFSDGQALRTNTAVSVLDSG